MRPMYQYGAADVRFGQYVSLGGQCPLDLSGSASYAIGFWVRPRVPIYDGKLLASGSAWYLGLHGLRLTFALPGMSRQVSELELRPDVWQYVLINFVSTGASAGNYTVYVDGTVLIQGTQSNLGRSDTPFVLGMSSDAQFFNVAFWSAARSGDQLKPVWDVPQPDPTLVACYSFSDGGSADVSGRNLGNASLMNGAQVVMLAPSLRLVNAAVQPSPRDNLTAVANGGHFSVQAWFNLDASSPYQSDTHALFSCMDSVSNQGFMLGLSWSNNAYDLTIEVRAPSGGGGWGRLSQLPPGGWHHLAATYDGSTLTLYQDGELVMTIPGLAMPTLEKPVWLFGSQFKSDSPGAIAYNFQGHVQAAGLWSRALSASEVQQYMSQDPSDVDGCVAYYAWNGLALGNQVTGNPPLFQNTATPALVATLPSDSTPPPGVASSTQQLKSDPPLPSAQLSFAQPVSFPEQKLVTQDQAKSILASLEPLVATLPESMREQFRSLSRDNLYQGLARVGASGSAPVGAFTGEVQGDQFVFFHHTARGKVEAGRMQLTAAISPCVGWIVTVAATGFSMLLAAFGVGFAGAKLISPITEAVTESTPLLYAVKDVAESATLDADSIIRIIKAFYAAGTLGKIFGAVLTGGWFTVAANCALLMVQVAALWATGGAYVAIVILQLLANFAMFLYAISQRPAGC
ncbi:LamG domain-containing protein [Corallococcus caeni]